MSQVAPVFTQASYAVTIAESTPLHTAVAYVEAHSTDGSKLIYSISGGNLYDEFGVDFSTGRWRHMPSSGGLCPLRLVTGLFRNQ